MDKLLDVRTLMCPEPMMLIRSKVRKLADGDELVIHSDDPRTPSDIRSYCTHMDHTVISEKQEKDTHGNYAVTTIRKGKN